MEQDIKITASHKDIEKMKLFTKTLDNINSLLKENPINKARLRKQSNAAQAIMNQNIYLFISRNNNKLNKIDLFELLPGVIEPFPTIRESINKLGATHESKPAVFEQGEFFPLFKPSKSVELKKEFALSFGGLERIETNYKHLLKSKLSSGLTLQEHIDKVKNWFNSLHGENMGLWIKLFAFVKSVKVYAESGQELTNFRDMGQGKYRFSIKRDQKFFEYFIRPDQKTRQYTTKAKAKFLKWLYENQNAIEFPMIINKEVWSVPTSIYQYAENVTTKEILFLIDTVILESEFKDYITINTDEIDLITDLWEKKTANNYDFEKYRLNNFFDIPLKFLLTLKQIYSNAGNFTSQKGFEGNKQTLTKENLNIHLGGLKERLKKHLQSRGSIRTGKKKDTAFEDALELLIDTTWNIAAERKWLNGKPELKNGVYRFNINAGYFAKRDTADRLKNRA